MTVSTTWVDPSAGGALDLAVGDVLTEAAWDGVVSDLLRLGGATCAPVAFTPVLKQGTTTFTLDAASWGYYYVTGRLIVVHAYAKVSSGTGQANTKVAVSGWGTDYPRLGTIDLYCGDAKAWDTSASKMYVGHALFWASATTSLYAGSGINVAAAQWGETASEFAIQMAAGDDIQITAQWLF